MFNADPVLKELWFSFLFYPFEKNCGLFLFVCFTSRVDNYCGGVISSMVDHCYQFSPRN